MRKVLFPDTEREKQEFGSKKAEIPFTMHSNKNRADNSRPMNPENSKEL